MVFETSDIAEGFRRHIKNYFPTISENLSNNNITQDGFRETPNWILSAINEPTIPDWWESELRYHFERVNAVVIIDLRRERIRKY